MTEIKRENGGTVRIADEVVAVIACTAALETEGVAGLTGVVAGYFSGEANYKAVRKLMAKSISVVVKGQTVTVSLPITVKMGAKIHEVSLEVQRRVKSAIETMTGLAVAEVNITIGALAGEKRKA